MTTTEPTLESWLAERATFIGASESPAILGVGYSGESPMTIYERKINPVIEQIDREDFEWGHAIQPVTLKMFTRRTGIVVTDPGEFTVTRHKDYPFIAATLDGLAEVDGCRAVVEAKNVGHYNAHEWEGDEPPLRVIVQTHHQMAAADADVAYAAACVGGNKLRWMRIERNDQFIEQLIDKLVEFWDCVTNRRLPPVDGSLGTTKALGRLFPEDSGESLVLPAEADDWLLALDEARAEIKESEKREDELKNRFKALLGEATQGLLPSGRKVTWKTQQRKAYEVAASSARVFRIGK